MDQQKARLLFSQLVAMFHAAGMQQMGKVKNPFSEKIERDLPQAQVSIDMLDMLKEKTRGNLQTDEERFLTNALSELKLNYVDERGKENSSEKAEGDKASGPEGQ